MLVLAGEMHRFGGWTSIDPSLNARSVIKVFVVVASPWLKRHTQLRLMVSQVSARRLMTMTDFSQFVVKNPCGEQSLADAILDPGNERQMDKIRESLSFAAAVVSFGYKALSIEAFAGYVGDSVRVPASWNKLRVTRVRVIVLKSLLAFAKARNVIQFNICL